MYPWIDICVLKRGEETTASAYWVMREWKVKSLDTKNSRIISSPHILHLCLFLDIDFSQLSPSLQLFVVICESFVCLIIFFFFHLFVTSVKHSCFCLCLCEASIHLTPLSAISFQWPPQRSLPLSLSLFLGAVGKSMLLLLICYTRTITIPPKASINCTFCVCERCQVICVERVTLERCCVFFSVHSTQMYNLCNFIVYLETVVSGVWHAADWGEM